MKKKWNNVFLFSFITLFIAILLFFFYFINKYNNKESLENKTNLEIVISRYNEDLEWLKEEPFSQYPVIVYNKGPNEDFYHASNIKEIVTLDNVGRESQTFLYHIIKKYEKLADVTVFLPGSSNMENKINKAKEQVIECDKHNNTVIIKNSYHENGVHKEMYDFQIDEYGSTNDKNKDLNPEKKLLPSKIRPFGKWHETRFPNVTSNYVSYVGIIGISKKHILQHPKPYYENLIQELSTHSNPEVGHFYERSWFSVFHPVDDAVVL